MQSSPRPLQQRPRRPNRNRRLTRRKHTAPSRQNSGGFQYAIELRNGKRERKTGHHLFLLSPRGFASSFTAVPRTARGYRRRRRLSPPAIDGGPVITNSERSYDGWETDSVDVHRGRAVSRRSILRRRRSGREGKERALPERAQT